MSPAAPTINEYDTPQDCSRCVLPVPDPGNYEIKRHIYTGRYLLIEINYPDCDNYEGNKILLYENTSIQELINQKHIDPHFSENRNFRSPIARFQPTQEGWNMGKDIIHRKG